MTAAADPADAIRRLAAVLDRLGVTDYAFTGGLAVGVWAAPRQTHDIDLVADLPLESVDRLLAEHDGIRSGPSPRPDLVRFRVGDWDVDLFVAADEYGRTCLGRAREATALGLPVRVVSAEDLLIHKMLKLRTDRRRILQDIADVREVAEAQRAALEVDYLRRWLRPDEFQLVEAVRALDDEEVLRRILAR
jgi:hypothetical protein